MEHNVSIATVFKQATVGRYSSADGAGDLKLDALFDR